MHDQENKDTSSATDDDVDMMMVPSAVTIRVDAWDDLFHLAQLMKFGEWAYRGQEDVSWGLTTGVEREFASREKNLGLDQKHEGTRFLGIKDFLSADMTLPHDHKCEHRAIETFRKLGTSEIKTMTAIEVLATMQHYGSKTRLLDFSMSMFVALFFAFENKTAAHDRVLYAVQIEKLMESSPVICEMIKLHAQDIGCGQDCLLPEDEDAALYETRELLLGDVVNRDKTLFDLANREIGREGSNPDVIPVFVTGANKRIVAQDGLFLMPLSFDPFKVNLSRALKIKEDEVDLAVDTEGNVSDTILPLERVENRLGDISLLRIVLSKDLEYGAWQVLDQANIHPMTIYPDLVGLAKSMRY